MSLNWETITIEDKVSSVEFPSSVFNAFLKQLDTSTLGDNGEIFSRCFPQFSFLRKLAETGNFVITSKGMYDQKNGTGRRYSGGKTLPRKRYFSICVDNTGNDKGTLCSELTSYWNSDAGFYVAMTDPTVHHAQLEQMGTLDSWLANNKPAGIVLHLIDLSEIRNNPNSLFSGKPLKNIFVPFKLKKITCNNVLDLRLPKAQDWLAAQYKEILSNNKKTPSFGYLICNLISPFTGGTVFDESIGAWLRTKGCNGLVYPSARRDFHVKASNEDVISSEGWNFVLYNGAQLQEQKDIVLQPPFPILDGEKIGVKVKFGADDNYRHWSVDGAEAGEWRRVYYEIRRASAEAPPASSSFDPYYESRRKNSLFSEYFKEITV